ncbi:MAG: ABC transporter permease subunit [Alphaproteobacteria bacterium]|nr:ABC transporter permease subunit [Alphaproteobacteria bacterium]
MASIGTVFRREFAGYFITPVAYVFIVIFLALAAALTFYVGSFFERGRADLLSFFQWHPWLYLFFMPAISMRLWAEERKTGTIELFLTLPVSTAAAVVGKFLAAWVFAGLALALTFPIWLTVNYLGEPDNGVIAASYIGSFLLAGAYLAIGSCLSALTRNQVIAFVLTVTVCFLFNVLGAGTLQPVLGDAVPAALLETLASFSLLSHFNNIVKGVIDLRDLAYYALAIGVWLAAAAITVDLKKAD